MVDAFIAAHEAVPEEIVLDLDATDDPIHGNPEGRFFHGYYGHYCYLPLYIFAGEHLLCARLRRSNVDAVDGAVDELKRIVGQIRQRWPKVRIVLRADLGFLPRCAAGRVRVDSGRLCDRTGQERTAQGKGRRANESGRSGVSSHGKACAEVSEFPGTGL